MELDKRIKDIDTIRTILKHNSNDIGRKGYFFDEFIQTKDLSKCRYGELIDITTHDDRNDLCFKAGYEEGLVGFYRFFIPEDDLNPIEKKYRPFSLNEFLNRYRLGNTVYFRRIGYKEVKCAMFVEYVRGESPEENQIVLGNMRYTLAYLFKNHELSLEDIWRPFGVIDE